MTAPANEDGPYTVPLAFLIIGAILAGFGWFAYGDDAEEAAFPEWLALIIAGTGGIMVQIGIIATAVVLGTSHLRR